MGSGMKWRNSLGLVQPDTSEIREEQDMLPLAKAGMAHLYFVCIHPFEDGNGRIGRAIAEKSIAQSIDRPSLISLATSH
jgi:Fic family protein